MIQWYDWIVISLLTVTVAILFMFVGLSMLSLLTILVPVLEIGMPYRYLMDNNQQRIPMP